MRHPKGYWTTERLKADALRFQTRAAWKKGSYGAYQAAHKQGLVDECCGHMERIQGRWTLERLRADALRFKTRAAWQKESQSAYVTAHNKGLLEECCGHMNGRKKWTADLLKADALRYQTRSAWAEGSQNAYHTAKRRGLLEECCGHMEERRKPNKYWNPERIKAVALQYRTRAEWKNGSQSSHTSAVTQGLLEECCGHMGDRNSTPSDNDTVYFWKAEGTEFYKIGVTSERLGTRRIDEVAEASGFTPVVLAMTTVNGKATDVETELLRKFNRSAGLEGFNGCTEFRHLASWEAAEVVSILATANN